MKPSIGEDKQKQKKQQIDREIASAKKMNYVHMSNFSLNKIPQ